MKHKILKRIIAVCLILSLMPVLVFATEENEGQTFEMEIGDDLTLTGTLGVDDSEGHTWTVEDDSDILALSDGSNAWEVVVTANSTGDATVIHEYTYTVANGNGSAADPDDSQSPSSDPDPAGSDPDAQTASLDYEIESLSSDADVVDDVSADSEDTVEDEGETDEETETIENSSDDTETATILNTTTDLIGSDPTDDVQSVDNTLADDPITVIEKFTITVTSADSTFTVQYYANIPEITATTSLSDANNYYGDYLEAINTDVTNGGKIPANDASSTTDDVNLVYVELTEDEENSGSYEMDFAYVVSQIYKDKEYSINTTSTEYLDILSDANNYTLAEIWVWLDDCNCNITDGSERVSACTEESHWKIVDLLEVTVTEDGSTEYHTSKFPSLVSGSTTNVSDDDDETVITITDDTFIRFVYVTTSGTYTENATFFDYDITSDGQTTRVSNEAQGINSSSNYSGTGAKIAFGNANTGTGLQNQLWTDSSGIINSINQHNTANWANNGSTAYSYGGATFGLVSDLVDGNLVFSSGVDAPDLFSDNDTNVIGKTTYQDYSLEFRRDGDTYILSAVYDEEGNPVAENLESFNDLATEDTYYDVIWSNNFWPMDSVTGADGLTGKEGSTGTYISNGTSGNYPVSDDGLDHNNLFGMKYSVTFELDEEYVGDLEYFFFGDDDLWVFLTDQNGYSQLVCDLGGVHSSIGAYVNLWNYIDTTGDYAGVYTLTFFYTERGLSGSTCFMQFTLPEVLSIDSYEEPELDKEVYDTATNEWASENTAAIGDTVEFQTTITVGAGYTKYVLHDELGEGFTLNEDSITLTVGDSYLTEGTQYEVILETNDSCDFEIAFRDSYLLEGVGSGTNIVVSYSAVLNESAELHPDANPNTTWLQYTDPTTSLSANTDEKETETYAYDGPDLDKKVKDASTGEWVVENTAAIGDIVDFQTIVTVSESCDTYVLHDVLDQGFTLVENSIAVASLSGGTDYVVSFDTEDGCSFEIVFDNSYLNELEGDTEIVVTYSAVLNEDAVIYPDANLNTTWLGYTDPFTFVTYTTDEKETETYTYEDPDLDKKVEDATTGEWVSENTAEIGDTVNFKTTITVGESCSDYVLHDVLDDGFSLVVDSFTLTVGDSSLVEGTDYEIVLPASDGCSFEIEFSDSYLGEKEYGTEIVVMYSAVLNENAVIYPDANLNTTWLEYTDPSTFVTYTTDEKVTETYTYPSDVVTPDDDPTTPTTTTTTSSVNTAENAQTGDDSNTSLWIALMLASGAGLTRIVLHSRKRRYGR